MRELTLSTPRLLLRPFEPRDAGRYHALLTNPGVRRFLLDDTIVSERWVEEEIRASQALFATRYVGTWAVILRSNEQIIGFSGFRAFLDPDELELFYGLDPEYWGAGYATEAAHAVAAYGFRALGLQKISASTDRGNDASIRVLERLGMAFRGAKKLGDNEMCCFTLSRDRIVS